MSITRALSCLTLAAGLSLGCALTTEEDDADADAETGAETAAEPLTEADAAAALAEQLCHQQFSCACSVLQYNDEATCIAAETAAIQVLIDEGVAEGGQWDEVCAGQLLQARADWGCLGPEAVANMEIPDITECPLTRGRATFGQPCSWEHLGDSCRPDLACYGGVCNTPPTLPVSIGEPCTLSWQDLPCESGSYCRFGSANERICVPDPQLGDTCDPTKNSSCGPQKFELVCPDGGVCESTPGEGLPCTFGSQCAPGFYCDGGKDFTCQARFEVGDSCAANTVCPTDAWCLDNICVGAEAKICGASL